MQNPMLSSSDSPLPKPRRERLYLLLVVGLIHFPLLLSRCVLWDSVPIVHALDEQHDEASVLKLFTDAGSPPAGWLHIGLARLTNYVVGGKFVVFACILGIAVGVFQLALAARQLSRTEAFFIAILSVAYPFYSLWQELIMLPYAVCILFFVAAAVLYLRRVVDTTRPHWISALLAVGLFCVSFTIQSLLVLFYALFVYYYIVFDGSWSRSSVVAFLKRHGLLLLLPIVAFAGKSRLFPQDGRYTEYNQVKMSISNLVKGVVVNPKRIVLDPLVDFVRWGANQPWFFLECFAVALVSGVLVLWYGRRLPTVPMAFARCAKLLGFAALMFLAGIFAYSAVEKYPTYDHFECRHGILASFAVALGLVVLLRFICRRDGVYRVAVGLVIVVCATLQLRNYILWENRFNKGELLVEKLRELPEPDTDFIALDDQTHLGMSELWRGYDVNWLLMHAWGHERHFGFDAIELTTDDHSQVPRLSTATKELFEWQPRKFYILKELKEPESREPQMVAEISRITLDTAQPISEWSLYWQSVGSRFGIHPSDRASLLKAEIKRERLDATLSPRDNSAKIQ